MKIVVKIGEVELTIYDERAETKIEQGEPSTKDSATEHPRTTVGFALPSAE